jgi:guanylate kinase
MNTLRHLEEFKAILRSYEMSKEHCQKLSQTTFVLLSAISSSGRNTIIRELVKTGAFHYVVSDTTRPKRYNDGVLEQDGVEYWFKSEEEILQGLNEGKYIEAALIHNQQVSGIHISQLEAINLHDKIAVSDVEVQGVETIVNTCPTAIPIFVVPPSYDEWLARWKKRGLPNDQEFINRLASARKELEMALTHDYYHFIVNDDLASAVEGVQKIANGNITKKHEVHGRAVAQKLLDALHAR